jgi:hypothetical protein
LRQGERVILGEGGESGERRKNQEQKARRQDCLRYEGRDFARASGWGRSSRFCCRR